MLGLDSVYGEAADADEAFHVRNGDKPALSERSRAGLLPAGGAYVVERSASCPDDPITLREALIQLEFPGLIYRE